MGSSGNHVTIISPEKSPAVVRHREWELAVTCIADDDDFISVALFHVKHAQLR